MVSKLVVFLCLCTAAHAFAVRDVTLGRVLLDSSTKASSETTFSSDGEAVTAEVEATVEAGQDEKAKVTISVTAEAISEVEDAFSTIVGEAVAEAAKGHDAKATADVSAEALGKALAETYTAIMGSVETNSADVDVCISAFALAESTATAYAEAYIDVLVQASNYIAFAEADVAARAIANATATAFSTSQADVCGTVKSLEIVQKDLAKAIAEPYATVLVQALANVQNADATAEIFVTAEAGVLETTSISTKSKAEADGTVDGSLQGDSGATTTKDPEVVDSEESMIEAEPCKHRLAKCCDASYDECSCGSGRRACSAKKVDLGGGYGYKVTKNESPIGLDVGDICSCS